jgi:adenosylcobinamide-GDP ribazoletransferase
LYSSQLQLPAGIETVFSNLINAFTFLTIIPLPIRSGNKPGGMFAFFPLVGLVVGLIVVVVRSMRFFPADLTAFLALAVWVMVTGGLHLDGFADSCDGLLATVPVERRLEIMKDPRAGSWAVIGLCLLLLGKWIALRTVPLSLLVLPPIMGRWIMTLVVCYFPNARPTGIGAYFRDGLGSAQIFIASGSTIILALFLGGRAILTALIVLPIAVIVALWAARRLGGGLTGDVYGAICELTELLCMILLTVP